ncbi:hypothetical protein GOP47_0006476 [Adiantum capillus-veneris]|uniref:Uncharacterized protein n=2 Tax=Adiantum capillus-veneris TaxID=13818 RepID=A0A9D4ZN29_ADICA|nr:hypothetical protein GOP47_0006476 [Adiantum capillus-veneris]
MGIMWVAAICFFYLRLFFAKLSTTKAPISHPAAVDSSSLRPACIITGASSGIGKATVEVLANKGYYVILAGRSMTGLDKVVEELELRHKNIMVKALEVDLTSTSSIVNFTKAVQELLDTYHGSMSLQLLVNNAGILATTERVTPEGYESLISTNYLGHYFLTRSLLPLLQRSRVPARIVNVGSFTHLCVQNFDGLFSLLLRREVQKRMHSSKVPVYQIAYIYETSKLFMVMFTYELHRRLSTGTLPMQVTAVVADPGIVQTAIFRELPTWFSTCIFILLRSAFLLQSPTVGCKAVVNAALAPPSVSGEYFFGGEGCRVASSTLSYNTQFAADLWNLSDKLFNDAVCRLRTL